MNILKKNKLLYFCFLISVILLNIFPLRIEFQIRGFRWLYILICSSSLSFAFTPFIREVAHKLDAYDIPNERKVHTNKTPLLGGVVIYLAFIGSVLSNFIFTQDLLPIIIASTVIITIGVVDDLMDVSALIKLVMQLLACFIVIQNGIYIKLFPNEMFLGFAGNSAITVFWIIGITNALNFLDGMDGLATGISCIVAMFLGIVAFQTDQVTLGWLSISILGACLGFLPFNFRTKKSASIFLGDAGSTFLGFILACLAVKGDWSQNDPLKSFAVPLLIFSILIYDMVYITIFRIKSGKVSTFKEWIDYVGKDHLHHRMESLLRSKRLSVLFIYLITISLGITAIVLKQSDRIDAFILILQAVITLFIISILERSGRKHERRNK